MYGVRSMLHLHITALNFARCVQRRISPGLQGQGVRSIPCRPKETSSSTFDTTKFASILSFHDGVAAVKACNGSAYHINRTGEALYSARFDRTFGFYAAGRAAVVDFNGQAFHIGASGEPVYPARYAWCGNFTNTLSGAQAPVRDAEGRYFVIDEDGSVVSGPYMYTGDPNSAGNRVVWDFEGRCSIVNSDGSPWVSNPKLAKEWIDASVPHKGHCHITIPTLVPTSLFALTFEFEFSPQPHHPLPAFRRPYISPCHHRTSP